jgi:predicted nucleotidyltransferase component of viral defense system
VISSSYRARVDLLLRILPSVTKEENFALKGGTAINLFVRDMPRLSIDLDLNYLPIDNRETALRNIHESLGNIKRTIEKTIHRITVHSVSQKEGSDVKLNCQYNNAQIKIEVNTTTRGHLFPVHLMQVRDKVQEEFGKFAAIHVVSFAELYGGKICAALDRQHPRDFFDIRLLLDNEGITTEMWYSFLVSLLSHYKPVNELLNPVLKDQGMTNIEFTYEDYEVVRLELLDKLKHHMSDSDRNFLMSFKKGIPQWELFPYKEINTFPAILWKLKNLHNLIKDNPGKHHEMVRRLELVLRNY